MTKTNFIEGEILVTVVFDKNHDAINAVSPDGSRKYRYIVNEGSSRSSKTRSLIQILHKYGMQNKNKRISVWRNTKKDARDTVGADTKNILSECLQEMPLMTQMDFNKTEAVYSFHSKSVFEINGTDDPNKIHGYNCHVSWFNEPYDISRDTFDQLDMRTEDFILIDWNPQQAHWIDDLKKDPRTIVIHSTFRDNPFCPIEQKIKILSYQPVKMAQVVTDKRITESEARTYSAEKNPLNFSEKQLKELCRTIENERKSSASIYKWKVYGLGLHAEKPNRIFFWEQIEDHVYHALDAKKYYGVDWGTVDPWGILEAKYYDGALYLHELNYASENQVREALDMTELEKINSDPSTEGLVKWMFSKLNIDKKSYQICDNNRPLKIEALWSIGYDYACEAPKMAGSIIDGIDLLTNLKVYYTTSSSNIRCEQENYSRMTDRYGITLNEPEDKNNHLIDPARYVALFLKLMGIIK